MTGVQTCALPISANSDNIELDVMTDGVPVHWSGFTDLKCCHAGSTSIHDAVATIEMKKPFAKKGLFQTPALQPKQQLIGQALALMQKNPCAYKLSFLTDLFALSVMYHVDGRLYLSRRVSDGKSLCLRLLLFISIVATASCMLVDPA